MSEKRKRVFMKWFSHLKTINHHKWLVLKACFRAGLYWQGLMHDMSKYAPVEFFVGAKYYQGTRSPNNAEREVKGYSSAWLHHKGRNKHHLEYWIDYGVGEEKTAMMGMKMPVRYVVEMFCDRMAASKTYNPDTYQDDFPLKYFQRSESHYILHPETRELLKSLLIKLAEEGEDATFAYIRKEVLKNQK